MGLTIISIKALSGQQFRLYGNGKGTAGYRKFNEPGLCQGTYFICMSNDNSFQGVDATAKVIGIVETSEYEDLKIISRGDIPVNSRIAPTC